MEYLTIGLAVLSAGSSIAGGFAGKSAADKEAAQYEDQANLARTAGLQAEAQKRDELRRVLAAQDAFRAGRGVDLFSATGRAIAANTKQIAETDIATSNLNYAVKARSFDLGASQAKDEGTAALWKGFGGAAGSLLSSAGSFKTVFA